jgi:hypothetical protein
MKTTLKTRFSSELKPKEILNLMLILYEIASTRDFVELGRFVHFSSEIIGPSDFNLLLRSLVKMMNGSKCGDELCSDWIMTNLYELYTALGVSPIEE